MEYNQLFGLLILLLGLAMITVAFGNIGHNINEKENVKWFWYLIIAIGVIAAILGGTLLYQSYERTRPVVKSATYSKTRVSTY